MTNAPSEPVRPAGSAASSTLRLRYLMIATILAWPGFFLVQVKVIPAIERILKDFDAQLPQMAVTAIFIADFTARYWWPMAFIVACGLAVFVVGWNLVRDDASQRVLQRSWTWLMIVLPLAAAVLSLVAACLPLLSVWQKLTG